MSGRRFNRESNGNGFLLARTPIYPYDMPAGIWTEIWPPGRRPGAILDTIWELGEEAGVGIPDTDEGG